MAGIDLHLDEDTATSEFDIAIDADGDFKSVEGLSTAILTSLLTDARADQDQVFEPQLRRGWIGSPIIDHELGSKIWLTSPSRRTASEVAKAATFAREALQWMIDAKVAKNIAVTSEITGPYNAGLRITIITPDGSVSTEFLELWEKTAYAPSPLPERDTSLDVFTPLSLANIIAWADSDFSAHTIDANCGVSVARDIVGNSDFFQGNADKRPLRLLSSAGFFYRFDGVDNFLATPNGTFASLREGTAFFIYKPTAAAVNLGRFFTLCVNGFASGVRGLAFIQESADVIRLLGNNGALDVSLTGGADDEAPFVIVARWGPASNGAAMETSLLESASDASYTDQIGSPNQAVIGAGFDGADPDETEVAGFELSSIALYSRRVSDLEVVRLLDYGKSRLFVSPTGEHWSDCSFWSDDTGWTE